MATFKKEVEKGLKLMCDSIGFKKKGYYFIKPMNDNIIANLSFGIVSHAKQGHIYVNVGVGITNLLVEDFIDKLTNFKSTFRHTISTQIGYLTPENNYKEWDFVDGTDNSKVYDDMLYHIKKYGFPYMEKMSRFDNLFEAYKIREPGILNIAREKYLPILYYLKGEKEKGLEFIKEAIKKQQTPVSEKEMEELKAMAGPEGIVIIGSGIGKVDPAYLEFVENYKNLPPPPPLPHESFVWED